MGYGYNYHCEKCGMGYEVSVGVGMAFPQVYQQAVEDVLAGESSLFSTYLLAYKDARKNGSTPEGAQDNDADETSESPDTNGTTGSNGTTGTTRTATPSTSDGTSVSSLAITALAVGTLIAAVITRKKA